MPQDQVLVGRTARQASNKAVFGKNMVILYNQGSYREQMIYRGGATRLCGRVVS